MIIFDTETTELLKPEVADLNIQPHMIEIAMVKLGADYEVLDQYEALLNPGVPIDEKTHKRITGLTEAELADKPLFIELYDEIVEFFLGESILIAHNLQFDLGVLVAELRRTGKEYAFPYPSNQLCTVNLTKHLKGRRLKLTELYEIKTKKKLEQKHRALSDVEALVEIVRIMKPV